MLRCLACSCHSSEPLIRRVLRTAHYSGWLTEPIIRGKAECLSYVASLPENYTTKALEAYIRKNSSWAVILGIDGDQTDWAEIGHGGTKGRLDGQVIIERYGND